MTSPVEPKSSRLTLRFERDLEGEFRRHYHQTNLRQMRMALLQGIFLYAVFGILDVLILPEVKESLWIIRYLIICPLLLMTFALSFTSRFEHLAQISLSVVIGLASLGIIAMTIIAPPPGRYLYYAGLFLVLMFLSTFVRLLFIYSFITSLAVGGLYVLITVLHAQTPPVILINNLFFLATTIILASSAAYSMEASVRRNFIQKRTIEASNAELAAKNDELILANNKLVESKEELIQSAKRADIIFSALSDALPGTILENKYRLDEKIGSGGFGTVYRSLHLLLNADVAVKVFRPRPGTDTTESLERFRIEGISAKRISHPNAVTVLDLGVTSSNIAFLVMELLRGHSLTEELREKRVLSPRRCAEVLVPVCNVLAAAHRAGVIHRDIKPSNIFLHHSGEVEVVKVVDFGIAKMLDDTTNPDLQDLTQTGTLVGTPAYMSPERLNDEGYSGSADVYSVGIMLYEMLTGRVPFDTRNKGYLKVAMMHMTQQAKPLREINRRMPEELEHLLERALAKNPDDRPTAGEMAERLSQFLDSDMEMERPEDGPQADVVTELHTQAMAEGPTEALEVDTELLTQVQKKV